MTQDELNAKAKNFAVEHNRLLANPITERLSPILSAVTLGLGCVTRGHTPRSHDNLVYSAKVIVASRKKNEHSSILAWQIASNQIRNNLLSLRALTRGDLFPISLNLHPETEELKNGQKPYMVVTAHSPGDAALLPQINQVLAGNRGIAIAAAAQPDAVTELLYQKAKEHKLTIIDSSNTTSAALNLARTIKRGGVVFTHQWTQMAECETKIDVKFLNQTTPVRQNIFALAARFEIPIVAATTTIEKRGVKIIAGPPIQTKGREIPPIAQDWADQMTQLVNQYPTCFLAATEIKFTARR